MVSVHIVVHLYHMCTYELLYLWLPQFPPSEFLLNALNSAEANIWKYLDVVVFALKTLYSAKRAAVDHRGINTVPHQHTNSLHKANRNEKKEKRSKEKHCEPPRCKC